MLSDGEKAKIRYHLGYANVTQAYTFVLGFATTIPFQSVVEGSMNKQLPEIEEKIRQLIQRCDDTEEQMFDNQEALLVDQLGEIQIRKDAMPRIRSLYDLWATSLASIFNVIPNPYDIRRSAGPGGGINVPVIGG